MGESGNNEIRPVTEGQRLLLGLSATLSEIGKAVGVSVPTVSKWRNGHRVPSPDDRARIASAFPIPAATWEVEPVIEAGATLPQAPSNGTPNGTPSGFRMPVDSDDVDEPINDDDIDELEAEPEPRRRRSTGDEADTRARFERLLRRIHADTRRATSRSERARMYDAEAKVLAHLARLDRERSLLEPRIVLEAPAWRALRAVLLEALKPFPDASRAVLEAIRSMEGKGDT